MSFCTQLLRETTTENPLELWGTTLVNPQKNVLQSIDFMQKLTVIAISNITYQRNIFPENAYSTRNLSGLEIKILKGNEKLPLVQKMVSIIKSALEALPMKYLRKMIFVIEELEVGSKEVYTLNFSYKESINYCDIVNETGEKVQFSPSQNTDTPEEIKEQTEEMLRKLNVLIRYKKFSSKKVSMTFRLVLTEDAPDDFQLKYFNHCEEIPDIDFPNGTCKLKLGKIATQFHTLTSTNVAFDEDPMNKVQEGDTESGTLLVQDLSAELVVEKEDEGPKPKTRRLLRKLKTSQNERRLR